MVELAWFVVEKDAVYSTLMRFISAPHFAFTNIRKPITDNYPKTLGEVLIDSQAHEIRTFMAKKKRRKDRKPLTLDVKLIHINALTRSFLTGLTKILSMLLMS
jgi:hypothetical protein